MSFLAELKRRNVIRAAGLYLVGAWLAVQVAGTILPMFGAAEWISRSIVIALAVGFLPAMIVAWVFELTPEGLKRDGDVPTSESIAPQTAHKMNQWLLVVSIVAIGYFAFDKFVLAPRRDAALVTQTTTHVTAEISAEAAKVNPNSIAVLPFTNMSGDASNEYFSDGISEEILNVLAQIPKLQVAARTSSFSFKGAGKEVPQIAKELKVRMVLEGSVRKQGERVRITAQLIDASNGFHVWSQTYDRDLKDIFAIQDEIAKAIADALMVKLGKPDAPVVASKGTRNTEAYDLYLRGLSLWQLRTEDALWQAAELFERAAASDPKFAQAYAGQALVYAVIADYSARISYTEAWARSQDYAERANALDPTLPEPYAVLGHVAGSEHRRETSEILFRRAIALRPSFATAHQWLGNQLMASGKLEPALASAERASLLDPLSRVIASNHSQVLLALGRYAEANAECERALGFAPDNFSCLDNKAFGELLLGHFDAARPLLKRMAEITNPSAVAQVGELIDALQGHGDRHALALRLAAFTVESANQPDSGNVFESYERPALLVLLGEPELALALLERLVGEDGSYADWAVMMPALDPIRCEPRFVAVVQKLKTHDPRHSKVCGGKF